MALNKETVLSMYRTMWTIRLFEERMAEIYLEGKTPAFDIGSGPVPGEMHLSAGQEPVAVGACAHLRTDDTVVGTHRAHHFAIAKGVDLKKMAAEIFGKATGLGQGKGGHMHLFDVERKFRETRLLTIAPVSTNLILAYIGQNVLGMPKSY